MKFDATKVEIDDTRFLSCLAVVPLAMNTTEIKTGKKLKTGKEIKTGRDKDREREKTWKEIKTERDKDRER